MVGVSGKALVVNLSLGWQSIFTIGHVILFDLRFGNNNSRAVQPDDNSCWVGLIVAQIVLIKPHSNGGVSGKACIKNSNLGM